jgi:peptidoglycan/LPS O-acetylase OafA/YrhL
LPGELAAFALGMAAANLYARNANSGRPIHWPLAWDVIALDVLGATVLLLVRLPFAEVLNGTLWRTLGMPLFLVGCTLIVLISAFRTPVMTALFTSPLLMPIGVVSYSFFLWHEPVLRLVAAGWLAPGGCVGTTCQVLLALAIGLVIALLSFRFTERWPGSRRRHGG